VGPIARVARHLPALGRVGRVAEDLGQVAVGRHAAKQADPGLAQRRHDPVVGRAGRGRADHRRLLPERLTVEADAALPLQRHHAGVGDADAQHALVQGAHELARVPRRHHRVGRAVLVEHAQEAAGPGVVVLGQVGGDGADRGGRRQVVGRRDRSRGRRHRRRL
jgi:hypothetical protein